MIGCDCLDRSKIDINEYCNHSSMTSDVKLLKFLSGVILNSKAKQEKVKDFEILFKHKVSKNDFCSNFP